MWSEPPPLLGFIVKVVTAVLCARVRGNQLKFLAVTISF